MNIETFKKKVEEFIHHIRIERNLSEHTCLAYSSDLSQFINFWQQHHPTESSLRRSIERYLVSLFYKRISKQTIARKFSCFTSLEKFLKNDNIVLDLNLSRPRLETKLPTILTQNEITHLLDTVKESDLPSRFPMRDKAILELLYATGVRCSELVTIRLHHIDMKEKTIRIHGKGKRERIVLFGEPARKRITLYFEKERMIPQDQNEALFLNSRHEPLTPRSIQHIISLFRPFLKNRQSITPHKIRHSFATHLLNSGADLRAVQELLGHQSLSSTEKYTHISLSKLISLCNTIHPIKDILKKKDDS